jgi:hypothetical protein
MLSEPQDQCVTKTKLLDVGLRTKRAMLDSFRHCGTIPGASEVLRLLTRDWCPSGSLSFGMSGATSLCLRNNEPVTCQSRGPLNNTTSSYWCPLIQNHRYTPLGGGGRQNLLFYFLLTDVLFALILSEYLLAALLHTFSSSLTLSLTLSPSPTHTPPTRAPTHPHPPTRYFFLSLPQLAQDCDQCIRVFRVHQSKKCSRLASELMFASYDAQPPQRHKKKPR